MQHSSRRPVKRAKREKVPFCVHPSICPSFRAVETQVVPFGFPLQTCEDLKARFYTIQAALMQARNASDPGMT